MYTNEFAQCSIPFIFADVWSAKKKGMRSRSPAPRGDREAAASEGAESRAEQLPPASARGGRRFDVRKLQEWSCGDLPMVLAGLAAILSWASTPELPVPRAPDHGRNPE